MNIFKILFPAPNKQKTAEQLAGAKAELDILIKQESMLKYVNSDLFYRIGKLSAKVATLQTRLDSFD